MKTWTYAALVLPLFACGVASDPEAALITDSELDSIQSSRDGLVATENELPPGVDVVHVRLAWGYFAGKFKNLPGWVNWSGGTQMPGAQVSLENLVYFDRHDKPVATAEADRVAWSSKTLPHFDGAVIKVAATEASQVLQFTTPKYSRALTTAELAAGVNLRETVDSDGHEVAIAAVPDRACAGFSYGYEKPSSEGWLGFAGLFTDASGTITGRLRFRADGNQLTARLWKKDGAQPYDLSTDGDPSATGEGSIDPASHAFSFSLSDADGNTVARVSGIYAEPSYSPRGSFQATVGCP
jgi:hypothetical protein